MTAIDHCNHEQGIPSKRKSSACVDYIPVLCTHCPLLLRLNGLVRSLDWCYHGFIDAMDAEKLTKLDHLEELKVVTRFLLVNLRKNLYCLST